MEIFGKYVRYGYDSEGRLEITLQISDYFSRKEIEKWEMNVPLRLKANAVKSQRTIEQNKFMWALIHDIAEARSGSRANDDWDIYLEALERSGAKVDYIACLPEVVDDIKKQFRYVKEMNRFMHNNREFTQLKVIYGSSKLNKEEMTKLLDTVLDMCAEEGIRYEEINYL